jgi:hypothetical protein
MDIAGVLSLSTSQITALASFGIGGAAVTGLDAYIQQLTKYGTREATGTKVAIAQGMMIPKSLSASQGSGAELSLEMHVTSTDGSTAPITVTAGQAVPAGAVVGEKYTVGPVKINGTLIDCESMSLDFGIKLQVDASGGAVYPTFISIMGREPSFKISVKDYDQLMLAVAGVAQGATPSVVYLRKLAAGGTRVADATAQHISFTIYSGLLELGNAGADHGSMAKSDLTITPIIDATHAIVVVNTATAIT